MRVLVAPVFWGRVWWRGGRDCRDWTRVDARVLGMHRRPHLLGSQKSPRRVFPLTRLGGGIGSGAGAGLRGGAERRREGSRDLRGPRAQRRRRPCPFPGLPFSPGPLPSTSILTFSHPVRPLRPSPAASLFAHLSPPGTGEAVSTEPSHFSAPAPPAPRSLLLSSLPPLFISQGRSGAHKPQSGSASARNLDSSSPIIPTPNLAPGFSLHFFSS